MSDSRTSGLPFRLAHVAAVLAALALGACEGPPGVDGAKGDKGDPGQDGSSAVDHGAISGILTITGTTTPAAGVSVAAEPGNITATSDASGQYSLNVPIGIYTVTFGNDPADGFEKVEVAGIPVTAGFTTAIDRALARTNPLVLTVTPQYQVGFGTQITLGVTVAGAPAGVTPTYAWTQTGGVTAALSDTTVASPTFTTLKFADVLATGNTTMAVPLRHQIMPIASQQIKQLNYQYKVTVAAGPYSASTVAEVQSMTNFGGMGMTPRNVRLLLGAPTAASYNWTVTGPSGAVTVDQATEQFASFVPTAVGTYTITEGTWTKTINVGNFVSVSNCRMCHNQTSGTNPKLKTYAEWAPSGHANLFKNGVNGVASDHYSSSCIRCHTTGYDKGADNGGFDDVAITEGWTFPAHPAAGTFDTIPTALQNLGSISCENCHGAGSEHNGDTAKTSVNYSASTCMACHYEGSNHDRGFLWMQTGHSDLQLAMDEGMSTSCARCHGAQGFRVYAANLLQGNSGSLPTTSINWTAANVEPITCQACHDPHTLGLRLEGNIQMLPSGFGVTGVGKGALCMACHNTRNGLHDDANPPTNLRAPHAPSQTDVFMGRNAYFMSGINISAHAAAADTCVTCHVSIKPTGLDVLPAGYTLRGTNHTFMANETVCASCHGANVTGEALAAAIEQGINDLEDRAGMLAFNTLKAEIDTPTPGAGTLVVSQLVNTLIPAEPVSTGPVTIDAAHFPADSASFTFLPEIHGRLSLCMTLPAPVQVTWTGDTAPSDVTLACFQLEKAFKADGTTPVFTPATPLAKALWNFYLLHGDSSHGVHNPTFVREVINNTIAAVDAALP